MGDAGRQPAERGELARVAERGFQVFARRLPVARSGAVGRQAVDDRLERLAEVAEVTFVGQRVERVELAPAQPREAAADDVNRPHHHAREHQRDQHGGHEHRHGRDHRRAQGFFEPGADQQRGEPDADRPQRVPAHEQVLAHFEHQPALGVEGARALDGPACHHPLERLGRRERLAHQAGIDVRHDGPLPIHDGGVGDVSRVETAFQDGLQAAVGGKGGHRVLT